MNQQSQWMQFQVATDMTSDQLLSHHNDIIVWQVKLAAAAPAGLKYLSAIEWKQDSLAHGLNQKTRGTKNCIL